jgi:L-fuculose-phosphate aldolase
MLLGELRAEVSEQGRSMVEQNLTKGVGGNLSRRSDDDRVAISPSGIPYDRITPEMIPVIDLDGEVIEGDFEPSTESPMHNRIYRNRPNASAVVHTHSHYATTFASLGQSIPPSHYLVSFIGDKIPLAGYATPGTEELGCKASDALEESYNACLLKNHGVIAIGNDVETALETALMVEFCARIHYQATSIGEPEIVPNESIEELRSGLDEYRNIK